MFSQPVYPFPFTRLAKFFDITSYRQERVTPAHIHKLYANGATDGLAAFLKPEAYPLVYAEYDAYNDYLNKVEPRGMEEQNGQARLQRELLENWKNHGLILGQAQQSTTVRTTLPFQSPLDLLTVNQMSDLAFLGALSRAAELKPTYESSEGKMEKDDQKILTRQLRARVRVDSLFAAGATPITCSEWTILVERYNNIGPSYDDRLQEMFKWMALDISERCEEIKTFEHHVQKQLRKNQFIPPPNVNRLYSMFVRLEHFQFGSHAQREFDALERCVRKLPIKLPFRFPPNLAMLQYIGADTTQGPIIQRQILQTNNNTLEHFFSDVAMPITQTELEAFRKILPPIRNEQYLKTAIDEINKSIVEFKNLINANRDNITAGQKARLTAMVERLRTFSHSPSAELIELQTLEEKFGRQVSYRDSFPITLFPATKNRIKHMLIQPFLNALDATQTLDERKCLYAFFTKDTMPITTNEWTTFNTELKIAVQQNPEYEGLQNVVLKASKSKIASIKEWQKDLSSDEYEDISQRAAEQVYIMYDRLNRYMDDPGDEDLRDEINMLVTSLQKPLIAKGEFDLKFRDKFAEDRIDEITRTTDIEDEEEEDEQYEVQASGNDENKEEEEEEEEQYEVQASGNDENKEEEQRERQEEDTGNNEEDENTESEQEQQEEEEEEEDENDSEPDSGSDLDEFDAQLLADIREVARRENMESKKRSKKPITVGYRNREIADIKTGSPIISYAKLRKLFVAMIQKNLKANKFQISPEFLKHVGLRMYEWVRDVMAFLPSTARLSVDEGACDQETITAIAVQYAVDLANPGMIRHNMENYENKRGIAVPEPIRKRLASAMLFYARPYTKIDTDAYDEMALALRRRLVVLAQEIVAIAKENKLTKITLCPKLSLMYRVPQNKHKQGDFVGLAEPMAEHELSDSEVNIFTQNVWDTEF